MHELKGFFTFALCLQKNNFFLKRFLSVLKCKESWWHFCEGAKGLLGVKTQNSGFLAQFRVMVWAQLATRPHQNLCVRIFQLKPGLYQWAHNKTWNTIKTEIIWWFFWRLDFFFFFFLVRDVSQPGASSEGCWWHLIPAWMIRRYSLRGETPNTRRF